MVAALLFIILSTAAMAAPPPEASQVLAKLKGVGLALDVAKCKPTVFAEGKGDELSFIESAFDCGDLTVQMEVSYPLHPATMASRATAEVAKVREVYGAQKNPYTGYVSQTAHCPQAENLWQEKFKSHPLLIGRLNERGVWGACGKAKEDFWGAIAFLESKYSFAKVRILSKQRQDKSHFNNAAIGFLRSVRATP